MDSATLAIILPYLRQYSPRLALMFVLGVVTSIADGVAIGLLIPFLGTFFGQANITNEGDGPLVPLVVEFAQLAGKGNELVFLAVVITGLTIVRSSASYAEAMLSSWI